MIAYYLRRQDEVNEYLRIRREEAALLRREIEASQLDGAELRVKLYRAAAVREMAMLPLAADEDGDGAIIRGLRRRLPNVDLVLVLEAGFGGSPDPVALEWAAKEDRAFITQDENTLVGYAWERVRIGLPMPGDIVRGKGVTIRRAIDDLVIIADCGIAEDFKDQVRFLPF